jgi:hypothetical protein
MFLIFHFKSIVAFQLMGLYVEPGGLDELRVALLLSRGSDARRLSLDTALSFGRPLFTCGNRS